MAHPIREGDASSPCNSQIILECHQGDQYKSKAKAPVPLDLHSADLSVLLSPAVYPPPSSLAGVDSRLFLSSRISLE
jgi:hypothetical protein